MISREEYEAHDVAGLLKEYFRELPDPLMTEDAYAHFITASTSTFSAFRFLVKNSISPACDDFLADKRNIFLTWYI